MRAIIIDDEKPARDILKRYVEKYCTDIVIVGEADHVAAGITCLEEHKPELVFLDVEMPYGNGFDFLEQTINFEYQTIFITAYSEYAIKALNLSAAYYILKPIDIDALVEATEKVKESKQVSSEHLLHRIALSMQEHQVLEGNIILPTLSGFEVIKAKDVLAIQADGNFSQVYLSSKEKKMVCRKLIFFQENLDFPFMRVHRSHMVNCQEIVRYEKGNSPLLTLSDGSQWEISKSYKDEFLEKFQM